MNRKELGDAGEIIAGLFLESKGCKIIAKNYRAFRKEIDIIAQKDEYIIFAEVKTRSSAQYGVPSESVGITKQRHIILSAQKFLLDNGGLYAEFQPRFDIIEIYGDRKSGKNYVRHIESAFITNEYNNKG